jgi:alpha-beta hydrolase superfamily lysophospholipase
MKATVDDNSWLVATAEPGSSRPTAFYFGPPERPLFGTLQRPRQGFTGTRILLCAPLGYEGLFAYLTLRDLAAELAESCGAAVMRFDYDGTGDSAGVDEDPDRLRLQLASVGHAIDKLKGISDTPGPLFVVGLRAGALLAAHTAAGRDDVAGMVLWAPCASGKAFLREQKAFSLMTHANPPAPPGLGRSFGARGFEANGFVFTDAAVGDLEGLTLKGVERPPARRVLLLQREDLRISFKTPPGWTLDELAAPGYAEMHEPPWLWSYPEQAARTIGDWIRRVAGAAPAGAAAAHWHPPGRGTALVAPDIEETATWFGRAGRRFGVMTRPRAGAPRHAVLLVTSTYGYRIGPNRLNVVLARHLAQAGTASFRIDVGGVGDSRDAPGGAPPGPYELDAVDDVIAAIQHLRREGFTRIGLSGVCAGAFLAWTAAVRVPEPLELVLVNLETFDAISYSREQHVRFQANRPDEGERVEPGGGLIGRIDQVRGWLRSLRTVGAEVLRANLPAQLRPSGLPARLAQLGRRGSRVTLIFSSGDHGLKLYFRRTALHHAFLALRRTVSIRVIEGPDHSFTPRWTVDQLIAVLERVLR